MYKTIQLHSNHIFTGGCFIRKPCDSVEMFDMYINGHMHVAQFAIDEMIIVNETEWTSLNNETLADRPYLDGKGGFDSSFQIPEHKKFWSLTEEEQTLFMNNAYRICVAVTPGDEHLNLVPGSPCFLIDPQGYAYPRYIHPFGTFALEYFQDQIQ